MFAKQMTIQEVLSLTVLRIALNRCKLQTNKHPFRNHNVKVPCVLSQRFQVAPSVSLSQMTGRCRQAFVRLRPVSPAVFLHEGVNLRGHLPPVQLLAVPLVLYAQSKK